MSAFRRMHLVTDDAFLRYEKQRERNSTESEETEPMEDVIDDEVIVHGIPKTMKTRALALLERLKSNPKSVSWDSTGQVKLNGTLIPKSNISDLISDAMRPRKSFNPAGAQEFFQVLNDINVPKDLVRNDERWKDADQKGGKSVSEGKPKKEITLQRFFARKQKGEGLFYRRNIEEENERIKNKRKVQSQKRRRKQGGKGRASISNAWISKL